MRRPVSCLAVLGIVLALLPARLPAQTAVLAADVLPGADPRRGSLVPEQLTPAGGRLFFVDRAANLWVTDGTALGTRDLLPLCHAQCTGPESILGHDGGLVYASAADDRGARRLWRTDGTRAGTFPLGLPELILPYRPGTQLVTAAAGHRFFFEGCTGDGCIEEFGTGTSSGLWVTDGRPEGTRSLMEGTIWELAASGGQVFAATAAGELWRSDGTPAGTALLAQGLQGIESLTVAGGRLFFFARDRRGRELWTSDGTPGGTRPVTAFAPPEPFDSLPWIAARGRRVYLLADDGVNGEELWRSDGTPAGTRRLTATPGAEVFDHFQPYQMGVAGGRLVFPLRDPAGLPIRWWTVPAAATAAPPALLCAGAGCPEPTTSELLPVGGRLVFLGADAAHGIEPWSTDGTPRGTVRLGDLCPGDCWGADSLTREGDTAYFVAFRGRGIRPEIWASDGTVAGTRRIAGPVGGEPLRAHLPLDIAAVGQRLYFAAGQEGGDIELWAVDGPQDEPRRVADFGRGGWSSFPQGFADLGGLLLFNACDETGVHLFARTGEGTATPLHRLLATNPTLCNNAREFPAPVPLGAAALFWSGPPEAPELWRTDGTAAGTFRLAAPPAAFPPRLAALPGRAVFVLRVVATGRDELWASDGSTVGTRKIADLPESLVGGLTVLGGEAFLGLSRVGGDFDAGQIWRTDGTAAGTFLAAEGSFVFSGHRFVRLPSGVHFFADTGRSGVSQLFRLDEPGHAVAAVSPHTFFPDPPLVHRGAIYFFAARPGTPRVRELWRSDGTAAGTGKVAEVSPSHTISGGLAAVGDLLVFQAHDPEHGAELWASDGTPAGTALLRDLVPGAIGSLPAGFTAAGGRVFFNAFDPAHGFELWQTDGTAAGTRRVQDLNPGIASSEPAELTALGDRLAFSADDGETGVEPWFLPLTGGPPCRPGPARLCLGGGRFQVEVDWQDFGGRTGPGRAVPLTNDTGAFWFFDAANLELVVKVLDGNGLNGHSWVFYGALSNVEYTLTVTDTTTGAARRYLNSAGTLASVGDTQAFGPLGASARTPVSVAPALPALAGLPLVAERSDPAALVLCEPGPRRLCLNGGRFAVTATWKDFQDRTGEGTALPLTGDTGAFWFFDPANVEVLVKVIDGRGLNGRFWVFYGALSNVEYELTVTDSETGAVRTYRNPRGRFASAADTGAF